MRILIAPDKFKCSLGAADVAAQIASGFRDALPEAEITMLPVADGGDGTASVICSAADGEWHTCNVHEALGRPIEARFCTINDGATAVMEMSEPAGLWRLPEHLRNPETASSFGVGEMLLAAAARGVNEAIVGLGGSATNDGGFGLARALGFRFFDAEGAELRHAVTELLRLQRVQVPSSLSLPRVVAAVDVRNPLLGDRGATRVFGPQKGATVEQVDRLELSLARLADVVRAELGSDHRNHSGAGAAGGLGFALLSFCGATLRSGFDVVAEEIGLEAAMQQADVVVTAEGRLDAQTLEGKAPAGVARLARKLAKTVCVLAGEAEANPELQQLFDHIVILRPAEMSRDEAIRNAPLLLRQKARELGTRLRHP